MANERDAKQLLEPPENCLQHGSCCEWWPDCWKCGFDRDEDARRKKLLETKGLSRSKKGLWQLRIGMPEKGW